MSDEQQHIKTIKIHVDKEVGPTFCLAKWNHTTMYLQSGETHSCYHPKPHSIPLSEIHDNPSALHNTNEKKLERKMMLEGKKPDGCQYCWNIESMGPDYVSDRHIRNASIYSEKLLNQYSKGPWDQNVNPGYIEINFGNECNFKCGYCHPKYSTSFYNEIKKYGPVNTVKNHRCGIDGMKLYQREEENPYVEAWWKWWPQMKNELQILRITGGEPTLHTSTWKLLKELENEPLPSLELNINSNLGAKTVLIENMSHSIKNLIDNKKIKKFKLFTSIDTWGNRAEYIRTGLDLKLWENNLHTYLDITKSQVSLMITFNILSVTTFTDLLVKILELRKQYGWYNNHRAQRIQFDTPFLREPLQYDINILPKDKFMSYMEDSLKFMKDNVNDYIPNAFTKIEYEKFKRVVDYYYSSNYSEQKLLEGRKDFYNWFNTLDERRNTKLLEVFPEMTEFYNSCGKLVN
jgi:organic radical activating enzyme